eukprot:9928847-Alexandrium_andersonii.AAC.1
MRQGEVFDACVSLFYQFVARRQRRIINDVNDLGALFDCERIPFQKIFDSGLMVADSPPPG